MTSELMYLNNPAKGYTEVKTVPITYYPDGTPLVNFVRGERSIQRVLMRPDSPVAFMASLFWIDALVERGHDVPELILPFVPGARQDRLNDEGDYLFTIKSVAKMINDRNFPKVTILDPHSEVTPALINRCHVIHSSELGLDNDKNSNIPPKYHYVISPDAGAEKRAGMVAKKSGLKLLHGWKTRDVSTGKITGFGVESGPTNNERVLIVDDICDGGGTFLGLAKVLCAPDLVYVDLFVTHGLFTQGLTELNKVFERVITTDSIIRPHSNKLTVINVCERLLKGEPV